MADAALTPELPPSSCAALDELPADLIYLIAKHHLPALFACCACSKRLSDQILHALRNEKTIHLVESEVTFGVAERLAALECHQLKHVWLYYGEAVGGEAVVAYCIDASILRSARCISVEPVSMESVSPGPGPCTPLSVLHRSQYPIIPAELIPEVKQPVVQTPHGAGGAEWSALVGLVCAPFLRRNSALEFLVTRSSRLRIDALRGRSVASPPSDGDAMHWHQICEPSIPPLSPETPLDNLAAVLVAGLLEPPMPRALHVDLTGLRPVSGAAFCFAEYRAGTEFIASEDRRPAPSSMSALYPTSLARSRLLACRGRNQRLWRRGTERRAWESSTADAERLGTSGMHALLWALLPHRWALWLHVHASEPLGAERSPPAPYIGDLGLESISPAGGGAPGPRARSRNAAQISSILLVGVTLVLWLLLRANEDAYARANGYRSGALITSHPLGEHAGTPGRRGSFHDVLHARMIEAADTHQRREQRQQQWERHAMHCKRQGCGMPPGPEGSSLQPATADEQRGAGEEKDEETLCGS